MMHSEMKMMAVNERILTQEHRINSLKTFSAAVNLFVQERALTSRRFDKEGIRKERSMT
jgi:hypothetical protein